MDEKREADSIENSRDASKDEDGNFFNYIVYRIFK